MAAAPFLFDQRRLKEHQTALLLLIYGRQDIIADERSVFLPNLQLGAPERVGTLRRSECDRVTGFEVADFTRDTGHPRQIAMLRKTDEEVPVFEQVERWIETAELEIEIATHQDRREW